MSKIRLPCFLLLLLQQLELLQEQERLWSQYQLWFVVQQERKVVASR